MNARFLAISLTLIAFFSFPLALAGGSAKKKSALTFHIETQEQSNPKMIFQAPIEGKTKTFSRSADFGSSDIQSFEVFVDPDGPGFGLVVTLKVGGNRRLSAYSNLHRGKMLLARLNGRNVDYVVFDRPVNDGKLVIWHNVSEADLQLLDMDYPRTGEKKPRGKNKKK